MGNQSFKFQSNDNVIYFNLYNKKQSNSLTNIQTYDKSYHHWKNIVRADNPYKPLSNSALELCSRLVYAFGKNNNKPIFKSNEWFKDIIKKCTKQTSRIRNQLHNIFNFKFHQKVFINNEMLFNVFEISFTNDAFEILDLKHLEKCPEVTTKNVQRSRQKCPEVTTKMSTPYSIDKEKEESLRDYSSFSDNKENEELKISSSAASFLDKPALDEDKTVQQMNFGNNTQSKFETFKKHINDPDIIKDFEAWKSFYEVTQSEDGMIILECPIYFVDRITECNRLDKLQDAVNSIGISLVIKSTVRCAFEREYILLAKNL